MRLFLIALAGLLLTPLRGADTREISCAITVPSGGYTVQIDEVHEGPDALIALIVVVPPGPDMMTTSALVTHTPTTKVPASDKPVTWYLVGKDWNWQGEGETWTAVADREAFATILAEVGGTRRLPPADP